MPSDKTPGKTVFVGNIPYGLTEEQVIDIFSSVGQVISFRLVHDRETHRPKGFGFAEFADAEIASSAVRNLNDYEVQNRKLRVDFSHEGGDEDLAAGLTNVNKPPIPLSIGSMNTSTNGNSAGGPQNQSASNILPPLPPGTDLPPGVSCPDAISRTLNTLPPAQLLDILSQMKGLVTADAGKATELLRQAPQLSYAIFQALLLMGLVDASALQEVVESAAQQPPPMLGHTQAPGAPQPSYPQRPAPPPQHSTPQAGPYGAFAPPPPPPPPQIPQPTPQPVLGFGGAGVDQGALIQQVLNLTQAQIDALNEPERSQIQSLRQQLMGGGGRGY